MDSASGSPADVISSTVSRGAIPNSRSHTSKAKRTFSSSAAGFSESKSLGTDNGKSARSLGGGFGGFVFAWLATTGKGSKFRVATTSGGRGAGGPRRSPVNPRGESDQSKSKQAAPRGEEEGAALFTYSSCGL